MYRITVIESNRTQWKGGQHEPGRASNPRDVQGNAGHRSVWPARACGPVPVGRLGIVAAIRGRSVRGLGDGSHAMVRGHPMGCTLKRRNRGNPVSGVAHRTDEPANRKPNQLKTNEPKRSEKTCLVLESRHMVKQLGRA
jgi:hypothetical protein